MYNVVVDEKKAIADLKRIREDQLPFAFSLGINNTAKGAVESTRARLGENFTINNARIAFLRRLIKFPRSQWATKKKLAATLGVHERDEDFGVGSSKDRGFLLGRHEEGGERNRTDDMRPFFVPTNELRSGAFDVPPRNMYPTALRLVDSIGTVRTVKITTGPAGDWGKRKTRRLRVKGVLAAQAKGKRDTFIVDGRKSGNPKAWGIFQRTGPGRRNIRMLWAFRTRIRLNKRLNFNTNVSTYVDRNVSRHFDDAINQAMRTAR